MKRALAAAALAALCAGGAACRKRPKAPRYGDSLSQALVKLSSPTVAAQRISTSPEPLPPWTRQPPRLAISGSRRVAMAVGMANAGNLALSRAAAEARARAELGRLLHEKVSTAAEEMAVTGARVINTYTAADGRVFVELEAPAHR